MSRYEGRIAGNAAPSFDVSQLISELAGQQAQLSDRDRRHAIACFLSASEGWRSASHRLGGAFAPAEQAIGLSGGKEE